MPTPPDRAEAFHRVTDVLRCKWTLAVLEELARGTSRPSELQRALPGLTSKVLSERLRKLERFGLVDRTAFPEVPPRVEYRLTDHGSAMTELVHKVGRFVDHWVSTQIPQQPPFPGKKVTQPPSNPPPCPHRLTRPGETAE